MKKIAIALLSLLFCLPAFGAYQGFKKALGKAVYGAYLVYPGIKSSINNHQLMNIIENDSYTARDEITREVRENLKQRGIKKTDNIKVFKSNLINPAAYVDLRIFGRPKSIALGASWESLDPTQRSIIGAHEGSHVKWDDMLVRQGYPWVTRPIGHIAYALALRHPIAMLTQKLASSKKIGTMIRGAAQIATTETIHKKLSSEPYLTLCRAQELRSDTDLLKDHSELISSGNMWLNFYLRAPTEMIEKDRQHPHPLKRSINSWQKGKKLIPKEVLSIDRNSYITLSQELEEQKDEFNNDTQSLGAKGNRWLNLYLNTPDEVIKESKYQNPLDRSLECYKQVKFLTEEKQKQIISAKQTKEHYENEK